MRAQTIIIIITNGSHCIFLGPLSAKLVVLVAISLENPGDFRNQRVFRVWV